MGEKRIVKEIDIKWQQLFDEIQGIQNDCINRIKIEREIIPIIFVPGIMVSRLKMKNPDKTHKDDARIWDPDDIWFMWANYGKWQVNAAERKSLLVGRNFSSEYAEVDNHNAEHNKRFASKSDPSRAERGWGGISGEPSLSFIKRLQESVLPKPSRYCFDLWVHAFGYNWTESNEKSGLALKEYIERIKDEHRRGKYCGSKARICNKVILVTHSMGGLVARSACMLHGAKDDVLGVVHGVQPATGSPAAYWRMKGGFERPSSRGPNNDEWDWLRNPLGMFKHRVIGRIISETLGHNGEAVTSILGNIPGGLELLPTNDYVDNEGKRAWLTFEGQKTIKLPREDVYREIYLEREKAYRLIESQWLDPGNEKETNLKGARSSWDLYREKIDAVKEFHKKLKTQRHKASYQFYISCLDAADKIVLNRSGVNTVSSWPPGGDGYGTYVDSDDKPVQEYRKAVAQISMAYPDGEGDGTVPRSSAAALDVEEYRSYEVVKSSRGAAFHMSHSDVYQFEQAAVFAIRSIWDILHKYIHKEAGKGYSHPVTRTV